MKKSTVGICAASALLVALAACEKNSRETQDGASRNRYGYQGGSTQYDATPTPTPAPSPSDQPEPYTTESTPPSATPTPEPASLPAANIAYGTPVPGKAGFVTSPHAPYSGYVDVRGFPPGQEVKCPYTGKIFLVP